MPRLRGSLLLVVLVGLLGGSRPAAGQSERPVIAGVLGLVPGFGTGYWYLGGRAGKATTFTLLDLGLTVGAVVGIDHELDDLFDTGSDDFLAVVGTICAYGKIGSSLYQCVDGAVSANSHPSARQGKRLSSFGWGLTDGLQRTFSDPFDGHYSWLDPASQRTAAVRAAAAAGPSWQLKVGLRDPGLGVVWRGGF